MGYVTTSVKAFIERGDEFLVLKEDLGPRIAWDLPGGEVEYGEAPEEALHREVQEETGLAITIHEPLGLYWFNADLNDSQVICHTYRCTAESEDINIHDNPAEAENIIDYAWMTVPEFLERDLAEHPSVDNLLQRI